MWGGNASIPAEPKNAFAILRAAVLKSLVIFFFDFFFSQH